MDWDDWGVWGGRWNGGDLDIDCNNCFNNRDFNGRINLNDVDWKNVDRSKIKFDRNQFDKFDRSEFKDRVRQNGDNAIGDRAQNLRKEQIGNRAGNKAKTRDVRNSTLEGLKTGQRPTTKPAGQRPASAAKPSKRPASANREAARKGNAPRQGGKPKAAARVDNRPRNPSGLGDVRGGKQQRISSNRGRQSMGGGQRGGPRKIHRGGGGGGRGGRR